MVVAMRTVETATTSMAPVVERVTLNGPTAGTVNAGGAITGGRVCAEGPPLGDGEDADADDDEPEAWGTGDVTGREVGRGCGDDGFGGAVVGAGVGVAGAGLVQQWPSP
jgi:hypothetical protein